MTQLVVQKHLSLTAKWKVHPYIWNSSYWCDSPFISFQEVSFETFSVAIAETKVQEWSQSTVAIVHKISKYEGHFRHGYWTRNEVWIEIHYKLNEECRKPANSKTYYDRDQHLYHSWLLLMPYTLIFSLVFFVGISLFLTRFWASNNNSIIT